MLLVSVIASVVLTIVLNLILCSVPAAFPTQGAGNVPQQTSPLDVTDWLP